MALDKYEKVLKVHIVDTGMGILPEDIDRVFEKFGKLLRIAEINHEGIGLEFMIRQNNWKSKMVAP